MKLRVLAATVFMIILTACSGGDDTAGTTDAAYEAAQDGGTTGDMADVAVEEGTVEQRVAGLESRSSAGEGSAAAEQDMAADEADADDAAAPAQPPLPDAPAVATGDRVIKEGTITIEVERDGFDQAFTKAISAARRYGGDVVGSTTRTGDNGDTFGSVTVRVPVRNFEDLVVGVGDIGTIRNRDIDAQDVTAEFTDLESRLRHLRAQEAFYLGLLEEARNVRDAIAVQQQLDGIQSQIEQIQGRLNVLEDRTSYSTLTVELFEPGAGTALATTDEAPARPTLAHYWDVARDAFINVIGAMLVAGLFALPLLIVAGALWFGYRTLTRPAPRRTQATPEEERETISADH